MPQLCNDPRFGTNRDRAQNRKALIGILETYFLTKTRTELDELFEVRYGSCKVMCDQFLGFKSLSRPSLALLFFFPAPSFLPSALVLFYLFFHFLGGFNDA